ncbi:transposase [Shinella sp. S4-D37]|uniref:transposase n=1 Tax=Shinella sp. S4-D37 TaxID=3161999 RepID=UPI00346584A0
MTTRLVKYIREEVPLQGINAVASNVGLDEKTIRNVYNESSRAYLNHRIDPKLKHLGIIRYRDGQRSASIIIDLVERSVVDVINGTRARDLERWLVAVPDRETIASVIVDPLRSYRRAVTKGVPGARIVTVPSLFDDIIADHIRRNVIKKLPIRRSSGLRLWFASEPGHSTRVRRMRDVIDARNPWVARAWRTKEEFKDINNAPTVAEANQRLDKWLMEMPEDIVRSSRSLVREILAWREALTFMDNEFRDTAVQLRKRLLWHVGRNGRPKNFNQIASRARYSGYVLDDRLRTCRCCLKVSRIDQGCGASTEHISSTKLARGHHNRLDRIRIICARCHSFFNDRNAGMAV